MAGDAKPSNTSVNLNRCGDQKSLLKDIRASLFRTIEAQRSSEPLLRCSGGSLLNYTVLP